MCDEQTNKRTLITIAVLNYNGAEKLKRTIPSILTQDYNPKEILVLDNASQDGSLKYLKQFGEIKVIESKSNLGYGPGKNALVKNAGGDYVLTLDNDVELPEKNLLSKLYEEYKTLNNPAFLSPLMHDVDKDYIDTGGLYFNRSNKNITLRDILNTGTKKVPRYRGGACFFRKDIFEKLGGFDEIYPINIDDYDMSARAYLGGYNNYRTTDLLAVHLGVETRTNIDAMCWKNQYYLSGFARMIWKNYRLKNLIIWWPISSAWILYKSLRMSLQYKSPGPLRAYIKSLYFFLRDLPDTIKQRKKIQSQRTEKEDMFLKIQTGEV